MYRRSIQRISRKKTYSIEDVSDLCSVHPQTVRSWITKGLQRLDDARPTLIHGEALHEFLKSRLRERKRPCELGQMFCCKCRQGRFPVLPINVHFPNTSKVELTGSCQQCGTEMHRYGATTDLPVLLIQFDASASDNTDLSRSARAVENANKRTGDSYDEV